MAWYLSRCLLCYCVDDKNIKRYPNLISTSTQLTVFNMSQFQL